MERLKPEELPEILTEEIIDILARMSEELPQSKEWQAINEKLSYSDYLKIAERKEQLQKLKHQEQVDRMTEEERREEEAKWKKALEDETPGFRGNTGEPETQEEYDNKYGRKKNSCE